MSALGGVTPAVTVGGKAYPESPIPPGSLRVNDIDGYRVIPPGTSLLLSPAVPRPEVRGSVEVLGQALSLSATPSVQAPDGASRFATVADPLDAEKVAYLLRLRPVDNGGPSDGEKQRVELSGATARMSLRKDYLIGFSMLLPAVWKTADAVINNPRGAADETLVFQIAEAPDSFDAGSNPSCALTVYPGGAATPERSRMAMTLRADPELVGRPVAPIITKVWEEFDYPTEVWQHFVLHTRLSYTRADGPFTSLYRAVGDGPLVTLCQADVPNHYNNVEAGPYAKTGIYYYVAAWTGGITERLMYSKGIHIWDATPGRSPEQVLEYLRRI